jgi:hypothetical protein
VTTAVTGQYGSAAYGAGPYGAAVYGRGAYGGGGYGSGRYGTWLGAPTGSLPDRRIGPDALTITLAGAIVPLTASGAVTMRHGRTSPDQQPEAATCTITVLSDALPQLPELGVELAVELGEATAALLGVDPGSDEWDQLRVRFAGHVTDLAVRPERNVSTGLQLVSITAVSPRARLGRLFVGDDPWPAESDAERAGRILSLAAARGALVTGEHDAGTVTVLGRDVDRLVALGLLDELAADSGGVLAERRDNTLTWHDAEHRQPQPPAVQLSAAQVGASTFSSTQNLASLLNDLTVTYGAPGAQGAVRRSGPTPPAAPRSWRPPSTRARWPAWRWPAAPARAGRRPGSPSTCCAPSTRPPPGSCSGSSSPTWSASPGCPRRARSAPGSCGLRAGPRPTAATPGIWRSTCPTSA